jgi:hypothetical protein
MSKIIKDFLVCVQEARVDFWNVKVQKCAHYVTFNYLTNCRPKNTNVSLFFRTSVQNSNPQFEHLTRWGQKCMWVLHLKWPLNICSPLSWFLAWLTLWPWKTEVRNSSEVYAEYQRTTRHYIPEGRALNFWSKPNSLKWCIPYALHDQHHYLIIWYDFLNLRVQFFPSYELTWPASQSTPT